MRYRRRCRRNLPRGRKWSETSRMRYINKKCYVFRWISLYKFFLAIYTHFTKSTFDKNLQVRTGSSKRKLTATPSAVVHQQQQPTSNRSSSGRHRRNQKQQSQTVSPTTPHRSSTASATTTTTTTTVKKEKLYCICRTPYDETKFYVGCDLCSNWFHGDCVGITEESSRTLSEFVCSECKRARETKELFCLCRQPYDDSQ